MSAMRSQSEAQGGGVFDGRLLVYYASSDTRLHVAESTIDRMLDYVRNTPRDGLRSRSSVEARLALIRKNARG